MRFGMCCPKTFHITKGYTNSVRANLDSHERLRKSLRNFRHDVLEGLTITGVVNPHAKRALENHGEEDRATPGYGEKNQEAVLGEVTKKICTTYKYNCNKICTKFTKLYTGVDRSYKTEGAGSCLHFAGLPLKYVLNMYNN